MERQQISPERMSPRPKEHRIGRLTDAADLLKQPVEKLPEGRNTCSKFS
jgi:hypothetical protein